MQTPSHKPVTNEPPLILVRDVTKIYRMGETWVHALRGVSLSIQQGEFVAIIGQSGSGKSTLMHIIGCLDTPSSGEVLIGGVDVSHRSQKELAIIRNRTVGFVFQTFNLLSRVNLLRNTEFPLMYAGVPRRKRRRMAREMLGRVGLGDRQHHRPNQLSGGQCQRAAIARALINRPNLILADEPTGNLDTESGTSILELLEELHERGHTLVLVTHDTQIAQAAQRQIRIRDGQLVSDTGRSHPPPLPTPEHP